MEHVWVWVTRDGDGQVEQHIGPFKRWVRDPVSGRAMSFIGPDGSPRPLPDERYATEVARLLDAYDGRTARDVATDVTRKHIDDDETGALQVLATGLLEIAARVERRQRRGEANKMRSPYLADFELAQMTLHVRAE